MIFQMQKTWIYRCSVISLMTYGQLLFFGAKAVLAQSQIEADPSFGTQVIEEGGAITVQEGVSSGENLFHRFSQFNVAFNEIVTFEAAPGIINIFSQVVGDDPSNIDGEIEVLGVENFFLMNPSGIIFGEEATLNVEGSFIATTADSVIFENGGILSADSLPSDVLELSIAPEALQFTTAASLPTPMSPAIAVQGTLEFSSENSQSLFLVGDGEIQIEGGDINAPDKQVGLASLQSPAVFSLSLFDSPTDDLSLLESVVGGALSDVSLTDNAQVNVNSAGIGSIVVFARDLTLEGGSDLLAGFSDTLSVSEQDAVEAGHIDIRATGNIQLIGGSSIENSIQTPEDTSLQIEGVSGDITIRANSFEAIGIAENSRSSGIYDRIEDNAAGRSGEIDIQVSSSFVLRDGAIVTVSSNGVGNPGSIRLAADTIEFRGQGEPNINGFSQVTGLFSAVTSTGEGNQPGQIEVNARQLSLVEGGALISDTLGQGTASNITVNVSETMLLDGERFGESIFRGSGIYSRVSEDAIGDGGEINISAGELEVTNGATINATTSGEGNAGNISITNTEQLTVDGQGELLDIETGSVNASSILADTSGSTGQGGDLVFQNIGQLLVQNGARVSALTESTGRAGTLEISETSESVQVSGDGSQISFDSRSQAATGGDAGNLSIAAPEIEISEGGRISARTRGGGDAGVLEIRDVDSITIDGPGSGIFFDTEGAGNAQGIQIDTRELTVRNEGEITVSGTGTGSPGDLVITADEIYLNDQARLRASTISETGGNIAPLTVGSLLLMTDGSEISAEALGTGDGGNVQIIAPGASIISRSIFENNDVVASSVAGTGGVATAEAELVEGFIEFVGARTPFSDFTASSELGIDGTTDIDEQVETFEEIPLEFSEASIAQTCRLARQAEQSEFVITGRGGLPPTPGETLNMGDPEVDLVTLDGESENVTQPYQPEASIETDIEEAEAVNGAEIVEPQGWVYNEEGNVVLVAHDPMATTQLTPASVIDCRSQGLDRE